jgi:hypothetical protein
MRKVSLDVNELRVETFETENGDAQTRGTVEGHGPTLFTCPRTQCGEDCLSGPAPCYDTLAWTNGQVACFCNGTGTLE